MHTVTCQKCGKEIQSGYNICPFCNHNLRLNTNNIPTIENASTKKTYKIIIPIVVILLTMVGYFGYQSYQARQYIDKIMPLYRAFEVLIQDQDNIASKAGKYIDLIDEMKKNAESCKDLRLKLVQIIPPNNKHVDISKAFSVSIDLLINRGQSLGNALQADLQYNAASKSFDHMVDLGMSSDALRRQDKEINDAMARSDKADAKIKEVDADFKKSKEELDKLLNVK